MSFYQQFATNYERVFPLREGTLAFLRARLPAGGRVLDLGCGTGHYCGALAAAGLRPVGVDLDHTMIASARTAYPSAEFHVLDLRDVVTLPVPFDGSYCIGNVLPHLAPDDASAFLRALARVLAPGGPLIIQTVNYDGLLPLREAYRFPDLDAGKGLVFRREYVATEGDLAPEVRFRTELREGSRVLFTGEERLWPLTAADLLAVCTDAGFTVVEQAGDFAGTPFVASTSGASVLTIRNGRRR
jgi:SAM-dependent methyltransferase